MIRLHCPRCERIVLDHQEDGTLRIRTRLILIPDLKEVMVALCPQCKHLIPLPFKLQYAPAEGTEAPSGDDMARRKYM